MLYLFRMNYTLFKDYSLILSSKRPKRKNMRFALIGTSSETMQSAQAKNLLRLLEQYGDEIVFEVDKSVDMVISLGGDGTFMRAAHKVGSSGIPIVAIIKRGVSLAVLLHICKAGNIDRPKYSEVFSL